MLFLLFKLVNTIFDNLEMKIFLRVHYELRTSEFHIFTITLILKLLDQNATLKALELKSKIIYVLPL